MRNSEICGEIRGKKIIFQKKIFFVREKLFLVVKIYPENQEKTACVEYSTVFSPPEELQIPENSNNALSPNASGNESSQSISESTISSSSSSLVNSRRDSPSEETNEMLHDLSSAIHDIDSKSSSATITPVTKSFPK
jgi:hypothetical protein